MSPSTPNFIDTTEALATLITTITNLPSSPIPSLYLDLEGVNLSRHGSISLLTLHILPLSTTYLIDIHTLGAKAFMTLSSTPTDPSIIAPTTLKTLLESPTTAKVFFDIRNDSDALYSHFSISLRGIIDLQLLELGSRAGSISHKRLVSSLAKCIKRDSGMSLGEKKRWEEVKERGWELWKPEKGLGAEGGGKYEVFEERPLREEVWDYCVQDVEILPILWKVYEGRLGALGNEEVWRKRIEVETLRRVEESQGVGYEPNGRHKALGPWVGDF